MEDMDIVNFMLTEFNKENTELCERAGMAPDVIKSQMEQSQPSLEYMFRNIFYKMKEQGFIAQS